MVSINPLGFLQKEGGMYKRQNEVPKGKTKTSAPTNKPHNEELTNPLKGFHSTFGNNQSPPRSDPTQSPSPTSIGSNKETSSTPNS